MTYRVLVRKEPANGYIATALNWPDCQVTAATREEAITQIQFAIAQLLNAGEIIELEIPTPIIAATYSDTFGAFRSDPTLTEFIEEVNRYRAERNLEPLQ
ncbi:MAG: hypothetical protein R3A44_27130 [Caldilineaceae bacterium]